jgi:hypothetical protein
LAKSRSVAAKRRQEPVTSPQEPKPELTPDELAEGMRWEEMRKARELSPTPRVVIALDEKGQASVTIGGDKSIIWYAKLQAALGGVEGVVAENVLSFLVNALPPGHDSKPDERTINAALSFVCSMQPRDEAEVMLLAQMAVTAQTAGVINGQMIRTNVRAQQQEQGNLVTKMMRTYTAQMESLKRYRSTGQQKVTVEHVHVYPGGKAFVGNVSGLPGRGGGDRKAIEQPRAREIDSTAPLSEMWGEDPQRDALSLALGEGAQPLPDARRDESGSAEGE